MVGGIRKAAQGYPTPQHCTLSGIVWWAWRWQGQQAGSMSFGWKLVGCLGQGSCCSMHASWIALQACTHDRRARMVILCARMTPNL